ncbi:SagB family peptide dehydrogenase [Aquincola sp. S2]|uniref:SagB family peptide dehydrogenase n=1 Tax=Pseudaquabacterium terrae TaxID=2732868 RepID=A0ABX2E974_9BURK|nr:SagB family peptide dehydrogenase [Aquabacterium terrae]NRF65524.1 SagB family peptide dehydrogenase [Aquabacterium terrae]
MPKLVWVALPLLAALVWLTVQWLRRRPPSRLALNIVSSLLLLAYVGTTASLGIFWVANQQLPVFDWHYLFGYATVLLVSLHLVFNLPLVWRWLRRPTATAPADAAVRATAPAPARRGALALAGAALAAGVAFVLGLRHGRSELRLDGPAGGGSAPAAAGDDALALVERFHAFSSHSRSGVLLRAPSVDWGDPPAPFKRYANAPQRPLPPPRAGTGAPFDVAALGTLLWHVAGVTAERGTLKLRASPSSGALFSTELYVVAHAVPGLDAGLWHYDAERHALERLAPAPPVDAALGAPGDTMLHGAAALVLASALFRRSGHKYRDRTYRYVLADLGHALENLVQAAAAFGLRADFVRRFDEAQAAATLGLDEAEEGVLALLALQDGVRPAPPPLAPSARPWRTPPLPAAQAERLGVTGALHRATSLRAAPAPAAAAADPPPGPARVPALRPAVLALIAQRRSVRRYAATPIAREVLVSVLNGLGAQAPWSAAVRIDVVVHAVGGLQPGAYRVDSATQRLQPRRVPAALREAARAAALDQDVIGDAAVVFVLSIERAAFAADPAGAARGYRHAFLEAGRIGERLYLEAQARGLGACAVGAFYDTEAAALVALDPAREWIVHFAALGVPA